MVNPIKPIPCEVLEIRRETETEWTFKVASDVKPNHGQFMQLSLPKIGEAPISISGYGEGYTERKWFRFPGVAGKEALADSQSGLYRFGCRDCGLWCIRSRL